MGVCATTALSGRLFRHDVGHGLCSLLHCGIPHVSAISVMTLTTSATIVLTGCDRDQDPDGRLVAASAAPPAPWFEDRAEAVGVDFVQVTGRAEGFPIPETLCGGVAMLDMDRDGDLDLYFIQSGSVHPDAPPNPPNRLYRNDGVNGFVDVTEGSGADDRGYGMGVATGDYDQDGDVDLYISNLGPNVLLRNDGPGLFTDVTDIAGVGDANFGAGTAFLDYDLDGDLDLYVANYLYWSLDREPDCVDPFNRRDYCAPNVYDAPAYDVLYRNEGDGTFTDVSASAGIAAEPGTGLGVVCGDFDGDGRPDIYVANDGMDNMLWRNQGDGTFKNVALLMGCARDHQANAKAGMGVATNDVDDDGDLDILVVNLATESDSFYQQEEGYFLEQSAARGLVTLSRRFTRFGTGLVDFDNDGRLDVYHANGRVNRQEHPDDDRDDPYAEVNLLYRQMPDGSFQEQLPRGGTEFELVHSSRAAAFGDLDNDGAVDIVVVNQDAPAYVLYNVVPQRGSWMALQVRDLHGTDALGATVICRVGERVVTRDVRTAYSFFAANDPRVHIGLGDATRVDAIEIRWSDGEVQQVRGPTPVNCFVAVQRQPDELRPTSRPHVRGGPDAAPAMSPSSQ